MTCLPAFVSPPPVILVVNEFARLCELGQKLTHSLDVGILDDGDFALAEVGHIGICILDSHSQPIGSIGGTSIGLLLDHADSLIQVSRDVVSPLVFLDCNGEFTGALNIHHIKPLLLMV